MEFWSNNQYLIDWFKNCLKKIFKIKILGQLRSFIGLEITNTADGVHLSQSISSYRLLEEEILAHYKIFNTPLPMSADISSRQDDDCALSAPEHKRYCFFICDFCYLEICTKPALPFSVSTMTRQLHDSTVRQLVLAKRVVRYISGKTNKKIFYLNSNICSSPLLSFIDADWAWLLDTRRSTSESLVKFNSGPVF